MSVTSANQSRREWMMKHKPWLNSTGPKTAKGKAISCMNALKTDPVLHKLRKDYEAVMKQQRDIQTLIAL